ncbi:MAG: hypothetical protein GY820_39180 [Gammaproteobacteria bacterium]|nr:hypothetical protein [Gammaproteobacteria bacterium]
MPKYDVEIKEIDIYIIEGVDATDESDAIDEAWELLESEGKDKYYYDSDGESEAIEQE